MEKRQFTVVAGKYESNGDMNIKYIDNFSSYEAACVAFERYKSSLFCEIEDPNGVVIRQN